jgi:anti-anti-sigma regulatory factor
VEFLIEIVDRPGYRRIRLVGRLTAEQVHELLEVARGGRRAVHLDLGELMSVDTVGLEVLHDLRHDGARLVDVPAYIQLKLDSLASRRSKSPD